MESDFPTSLIYESESPYLPLNNALRASARCRKPGIDAKKLRKNGMLEHDNAWWVMNVELRELGSLQLVLPLSIALEIPVNPRWKGRRFPCRVERRAKRIEMAAIDAICTENPTAEYHTLLPTASDDKTVCVCVTSTRIRTEIPCPIQICSSLPVKLEILH